MRIPVTPDNMMVAVMSHNMGALLRNCLESIVRNCGDIKVRVYDDHSDDVHTCKVLASFADAVTMDHNMANKSLRHWKTGGLWQNMTRAYSDAIDNGFQYVMFIQDDMQIVRPVGESVFSEWSGAFDSDEAIVQIRVMFLKNPRVNPEHDRANWIINTDHKYMVRRADPHGMLSTGIVDIGMLDRDGYIFVSGEAENAAATRNRGWYSVYPFNPVAMQLPWPPTMNNDKLSPLKRIAQRVTDRAFRVGYHPFRDMTPDEVRSMLSRSDDKLPYGEDFLHLLNDEWVPRPWYYERSYAYPVLMYRSLRNHRSE